MKPDALSEQAVHLGATPAEADAWTWIGGRAHTYPRSIPPQVLRPPKRVEKPRYLYALMLELAPGGDPLDPVPLAMWVADMLSVQRIAVADGEGLDSWLWRVLLCCWHKGAYLCLWEGATLGFHVLLRHCAKGLADSGFTVHPMASANGVLGVEFRRGEQAWLMADVGTMTGSDRASLCGFTGDHETSAAPSERGVLALWRTLDRLQGFALKTWGTGARMTVGSMAVKVLAASLPTEPVWFRPNPLLVAMCRAGGAYRGGLVYAEKYSGPAWRVDANKLYTWALSQGLPTRSALGRCNQNGVERDGIYLTRVEGVAGYPTPLATWPQEPARFRKQSRFAWSALACLPYAEVIGLRALGYKVQPLFGWVFTEHVDTSGFVGSLIQAQCSTERGTPEHALAKRLANALYGKLGESPDRTDVIYAPEAPDESWWPYVTTSDKILPGLWVKRTTRYRPYHHVDAAAVITARGRARMYVTIADWLRRGGRIVHVDTDGMLLTSDPDGIIPLSETEPGAFRCDAWGLPCNVVGPKWYSLGSVTVAAGASGITAPQLAIVAAGGQIAIDRHVLASPFDTERVLRSQTFIIGRSGGNLAANP